MVERPILFKGRLVRAILEGRKTQTRRLITPQPKELPRNGLYPRGSLHWSKRKNGNGFEWDPREPCRFPTPYGMAGDRLWVRENWAIKDCGRRVPLDPNTWGGGEWPVDRLQYPATDDPPAVNGDGTPHWWNVRPSIHMPRWASRLTLEVVKVRVERLQDISEEDARAEGVIDAFEMKNRKVPRGDTRARARFAVLWDSVNGKRPGASWKDNPWLWVVEFKRARPRAGAASTTEGGTMSVWAEIDRMKAAYDKDVERVNNAMAGWGGVAGSLSHDDLGRWCCRRIVNGSRKQEHLVAKTPELLIELLRTKYEKEQRRRA